MSARRVLVTNWGLVNRAGSELYVRDLVGGLLRRGHEPVVWSPLLGEVADEIRATGVQVVDDLAAPIPEPDLLHCQHHDETLAALARFPDRPGLFVQHGAVPWQEEAPLHQRLLRYVAVDELCRQRLLGTGIAPQQTTVVPNWVDLDRFVPREPLPARLRRALLLSNTAREDGYVPAVREACARLGIHLDVRGLGVAAPLAAPEHHLRHYDVVFAKARAALEALAVGCAVVVVDEVGLAGMVTHDVLPDWLPWNLGRHLLDRPHDPDLLCQELQRYDPEDAARCAAHVRANRSLDAGLDALLGEYDRVVDQWSSAPAPDHRAELRSLAPQLGTIGPLRAALEAAEVHEQERAQLEAALAASEASADEVRARAHALELERDALRHRRAVRWVDAVAARRADRAG